MPRRRTEVSGKQLVLRDVNLRRIEEKGWPVIQVRARVFVNSVAEAGSQAAHDGGTVEEIWNDAEDVIESLG